MSSTRATTLILLVATVSSSAATFSRRILHQPFFPLSSAPPPLPFSTSPPDDQQPFFQSYPSPPPPLLNPSPFASFPANITSLNIPRSSHNPVSHKLVALTVSLSFSAALIACIALFFYFRHSNTRRGGKFDGKAASVISETATPPPPPPPPRPPNLNSSEFLYLGTLASSAGIDGVRPGGRGGSRGSSRPRKLDSPELHPLQPLHGRQQRRSGDGDEDCDEFYSPRGSISGSDSRRVFVTILEAEKLAADNNGGNTDDATSFSSSSRSVSPARSASISISPPISASPKNRLSNSYPKSSPEFIELQFHTPFRPSSVLFSPPYSPSSETEKGAETVKVEEEESPLLSSSSSSSRMTLSPPESPRLSPLSGRIGKRSDEEREFHAPIPGRKSSFSSLKLPQFLGGGKRKSSPELTSVSNSPESSHSHPSPISSSGSSTRKSRRLSSVAPTAPPPPPPPPPLPPLVLGRPRSPPPPPVSKPGGTAMPLKSVLVEKETEELMAGCPICEESEEATHKPKLKPLHWDKVMANSDREMVWDQLRSSSFQLNEEMIETLFVVNNHNNPSTKEATRNLVSPSAKQENRVLDPKKAQNIAILLRALNVTMDEVCEALVEGNAETLGTELLESLLKMEPTKEEERKLKEYKDDSPVKLGHAEKFLKAVIDIPFAFKRVEAMLYIANFESEVEYLKKSFVTLEVACDELRSSRMFLKLLEAVLKTGNRMNVGTNRGDAQAFKLDTLLKLVDIKGADGKTTLLHFVVQEIIRTEGQRLSTANNQPSNDETKCRKLGLQVVSSLSSELANVKKAASMDSDVLSNDVSKLSSGLRNIVQVVKLIAQVHSHENNRRFSESMNKFIKMAEEDICRVQAQERVALSLVKEITEYFHGNSAKEEAHPFRIFMVVRDLLTVLDRVCKEVSMINERTITDSAHRFPVPVNPMLPVSVNPLRPQVLPGFPSRRQSSFSDDGSL